jgi:hypothetical protein
MLGRDSCVPWTSGPRNKGRSKMRTYFFLMETLEDWEKHGRIILIKANTLRGAFKKAKKKFHRGEEIYEVLTRREGCKLPQPCWDFWNGSMIY